MLQKRCICRGFNSECNYCYGTGELSDEQSKSEYVSSTYVIKVEEKKKSPSRQKAKTLLTKQGKLTLEEAILVHAKKTGKKSKNAQRLVRYLKLLARRVKTGDAEAVIHYPSLRMKLAKTLHMERQAFSRFFDALIFAINNESNKNIVNVNLEAASSGVQFNHEEISLLWAAKRSTLPKNVQLEAERQAFVIFKNNSIGTKANKAKERSDQRERSHRNTLMVFVPDTGLTQVGINMIKRRIDDEIEYAFVAGTKRAFREFNEAFPRLSSIHIENVANAKLLKQSASSLTVDLRPRLTQAKHDTPEPDEEDENKPTFKFP